MDGEGNKDARAKSAGLLNRGYGARRVEQQLHSRLLGHWARSAACMACTRSTTAPPGSPAPRS